MRNDEELVVSKRLWGSNWNKDYVQLEIDHTIDSNDIGGIMVDSVRKWGTPLRKLPQTSKGIRRLEYRMRLNAWTVLMLDWNFNLKYLECGDVKMNLVQIMHMGSFKAYVCDCHTQMNGTSKMYKLAKKFSVLGGVSKVGGKYHLQFS